MSVLTVGILFLSFLFALLVTHCLQSAVFKFPLGVIELDYILGKFTLEIKIARKFINLISFCHYI